MKNSTYKYTLMRKHKRTGQMFEGLSGNDMSSLYLALKSAKYEYPDYEHWIRENKQSKFGDIFIGA